MKPLSPPPAGLTILPATATAAEISEICDRDGGVIVRQVLSPDLLARINAELEPYLKDIDPATAYGVDAAGAFGLHTKRLEGLVEKSDAVVEALLDSRFQEVVARTLTWGGEFQLNTAQLIEIGPGEPAQVLHRDEMLWPEVAGGPHQLMISCMLALSDFTEEVGATRIAPGSNRDQSVDSTTLDVEKDTVPAVMNAGDALFFNGKVIHGGGANRTTDRSRRGLSMTYSLGWLKPEEAQTLAVSRERARQLPPRMRELCCLAGYRPYGPDIPVVSHRLDMKDPYTVIFGEERPKYPHPKT